MNATTSLYDLAYRNYDPAIGRFQQVDPLTSQYHSYSSYNYALNNPVMMNDPSGAKADDPWATMTGVDKTLGRLQAWSDFMDNFSPFYSGSHGGGEELGRAMHKMYNPGKGYCTDPRVNRLPSGKIPDAIDFKRKIVRELKSSRKRSQARGDKQVETYRKELQEIYGGSWRGYVDRYANGKIYLKRK